MAETATTTTTAAQGETTTAAAPPTAETQQSAKSTTATTTEEKTFTQAEVEALIQERLARVKAPAQQAKAAEAPAPAQDSAMQAQLAALQQVVVQTEVKAQMALSGVQPEKVERACRLADMQKCVNADGEPDVEKIKAEIEALVKDFPELKATTAEGSAGFKIGADGASGKNDGSATADAISTIFGNKKI